MRRKLTLALAMAMALVMLVSSAMACTTFGIGKDATADGSTIVTARMCAVTS